MSLFNVSLYLSKLLNKLPEYELKQSILHENYHQKANRFSHHHVNYIGHVDYHHKIKNLVADRIQSYLYFHFEKCYLMQFKNYCKNGKYGIQFGKLGFSKDYQLTDHNDRQVNLRLPLEYYQKVLGTGFEIIDQKYLTINLSPLNSLIKDCALYQVEALKIAKPFRHSENEILYVAKFNDRVLYAHEMNYLNRKILAVMSEIYEIKREA